MSFLQYLRDTRSEMNHVAWPTRTQTVVFTALVAIVSILIALYLGFFDFVFTRALSEGLKFAPSDASSLEMLPVSGGEEQLQIENIELAPESNVPQESPAL